ncbi:MAG: hypothetical protein KDA69_18950, partial [Planctomycetaceae bacterium]|nr:hypothetical protein [Planctomycetaceae bacterium]
FNFAYSLFKGQKAGMNPWLANGLEWVAPSPPGHGNFAAVPTVYRGPYEYSAPERDDDHWLQTEPPKGSPVPEPPKPEPTPDSAPVGEDTGSSS